MKSVLFLIISLVLLTLGTLLRPPHAFAQESVPSESELELSVSMGSPIEDYFRGRVQKIIEEQKIQQDTETFYVQEVEVKRLDTQEVISVTVGNEFQPLNENQRLRTGRTVILAEQKIDDTHTEIVVVDIYRANTIFWLLGVFFILVIMVARWQGLLSIVGMLVSLLVLTTFIIPQILAGENPIVVALIGSAIIAALSIYLCHGWSIKSHLALFSIMSILCVVALVSTSAVAAAQIVGLGSEEAYFLQFGATSNINLQGLLLAGILLGALGDDICVAQIAIVIELKTLKKDISTSELYERGLNIGRDHVASLVNTLILAYAGANLPLFLMFTINEQVPSWVTLNSEVILEEVIRTLAGSIGLVMAVPISTLVAALAVKRLSEKTLKSLDSMAKAHAH
jgi:uncharacterized membrane protein